MKNGTHQARAKEKGRRRRYGRTTPVGRARKNLEKMEKAGDLVAGRFSTWLGGGDAHERTILSAVESLDDALKKVRLVIRAVDSLEAAQWSPPKRSSAVSLEEGAPVRIAEKHRQKYLQVYGADVLDDLIVSQILPSGIAVKHGKASPFIVPKSHLRRAPAERSA